MVTDFLMFTSRPSAKQWSLISLWLYQDPLQGNGHGFSLHQDPLRDNGHWFVCHIKALCEVMVTDFFTSRCFVRQRSLISLSHQCPLRGNGHRFLYIKTLCETMVIDLLLYIKTLYEAMAIDFLLYIKTLYEAMAIDFFVTSRPFAKQWSLIYFLSI